MHPVILEYYKLDGSLRFEIPVIPGTNFDREILYTPHPWANEGEWKPDETIILTPDQKWFTFFFSDDFFCLTAMFKPDGSLIGHAIDMISGVEKNRDGYKVVDMELDIWKNRFGKVKLLDEDEFKEMIDRGIINPEHAELITNHADSLILKCAENDFPANILEEKYLKLFPVTAY